jgi:hypothetical protein
MKSLTEFSIAYQAATPEVRALIDSEKISSFVTSLQLPYAEDDTWMTATIAEVLLGLTAKTDLPDVLPAALKMTVAQAQPIIIAVQRFIQEVTSSPNPAIAQKPNVPEQAVVIDPMRTMEADVDRIHGYGAYRELYPDAGDGEEPIHRTSQDDVLSRKPLAEAPKYQLDESPLA